MLRILESKDKVPASKEPSVEESHMRGPVGVRPVCRAALEREQRAGEALELEEA